MRGSVSYVLEDVLEDVLEGGSYNVLSGWTFRGWVQ